MSNALEAASLIMVPSGYEDGTLGSLKPTDGSGDFTFSRGSNLSATRINEQGYIEKGYENLLLQSNSFLTTWITSGQMLTPVGGQSGYDGTNDAWKIQRSDTTAQNIKQNVSQSGVQTFSVYAKKGNVDYISLISVGGAVTKAIFSLPADGSGTNTLLDSDNISASIEYISEGWYRVSATFNQPITDIRIYPSETASTEGGSVSDAFIYIQDAMLNQGLVAYPYIETTTAPVAGGILEDMPRLDYSNGSCPALLLEPERTNLVSSSEYFSSWGKIGSPVITDNTTETLSPEGEYNASKIIGNGSDAIYRTTSSSIGGSNVKSIYLKGINGGETCLIKDVYQTNVVTTCNLTTEWKRFESIDNQNANIGFWLDDIPASGIYVWGAQLEYGSYPTSYIPTYGVSQTRLAESCVVNNATSSIGQTEGTIFLDFVYENNGGAFYASYVANATGFTDFVGWRINDNKTTLDILIRYNNVFQVLDSAASVFAVGNRYKVALKYSSGDIKVFVNNQEKYSSTATYTTPSVPLSKHTISGRSVNLVDSYQLDNVSKINQALLFPTALTDSECIELTTIS